MVSGDPPGGIRDIRLDGPNTGNFTDLAAGAHVGDINSGTIFRDNVFVIQVSAEASALLQAAPTAAPSASPTPGGAAPAIDVSPFAEIVTQAYAGLRAAEDGGRTVDAVQAGAVRISKVELLLKRAVVVKAEAAQMMAENVGGKQQELQALQLRSQSINAFDTAAVERFQAEQEQVIWRDFDREAFSAKLGEAQELLNEALAIEETNTEALLQLAELLMALTPHDVSDEERVLTRAHALLGHARSDDDRFKQAQALLLSAQSLMLKHQRTPPGPELAGAVQTCLAMLTEARDQFRRLNRTLWSTAADQLLQQLQAASAAAGSAAFAAPASRTTPQGWSGTPPPAAAMGAAPAWQPMGQWNVTIMMGTMPTGAAYLWFGPDQSFQAVVSPTGMSIQGRWDFLPTNAMLLLQGMVNGMVPYALQIQILQWGPGAAVGVDGSGATYQFMRTA